MSMVSEENYPFVLCCRDCGTHYAYLKKKPELGDILTPNNMVYATGKEPKIGNRIKNCFHCGNYVVFNISQIQFRGYPLNHTEKNDDEAKRTE